MNILQHFAVSFDIIHFILLLDSNYFKFDLICRPILSLFSKIHHVTKAGLLSNGGERGGSVVECRTPEREVRGSRPTSAVLCPWARHFTPRKYWLITQEAMAPSRHDWKIVDWDVKPQYNQQQSLATETFKVLLFLMD